MCCIWMLSLETNDVSGWIWVSSLNDVVGLLYDFSLLVQILTFLQFGGYTLVRNSSSLFQSFGFDTQPVIIGLIIFQVCQFPCILISSWSFGFWILNIIEIEYYRLHVSSFYSFANMYNRTSSLRSSWLVRNSYNLATLEIVNYFSDILIYIYIYIVVNYFSDILIYMLFIYYYKVLFLCWNDIYKIYILGKIMFYPNICVIYFDPTLLIAAHHNTSPAPSKLCS